MTVVTTSLAGASGSGGGSNGTNGTNGTNGVGFRAPVAVAYAASLTLDCTSADTFNVGALTGPLTLNLANAVDGQKLLVRLTQDATGSRLLTLGTSIAVSADIPTVTLSTAAGKLDVLGFVYNAGTSKYNLVAFTKGF